MSRNVFDACETIMITNTPCSESVSNDSGMLVGYARTSTTDQEAGFDAQLRDLKAAGCQRVFSEQTSAVGPRPQLDEAMRFLRQGDVLVVTKLDRLARSMAHLVVIVAQLQERGAALRIVGLGLDTGTPTGKLMLNMLGAVAEFERAMMLERQREGVAKAKSEGKYRGRAPTALAKAEAVRKLLADGVGASEAAERVGISRASVYRIARAKA